MTGPDEDRLNTALDEYRRGPSTIPGLTGEHAREWRQFARWAAATDIAELPDGGYPAAAVLGYLAEPPAPRPPSVAGVPLSTSPTAPRAGRC